MKVCKKCNIEKPLDKFCKRKDEKDGLHRYCKDCMNKDFKEYYPNVKEEHNNRSKGWVKKNHEYHKKLMNDHYHNNKDYYREWCKNKYDTDLEYRLKHVIVARIHEALINKKNKKTIEYLGCTIEEYIQYLEQKFTLEMTWDNYGIYWEIDHIHPLAKGGSFHYTNTQPLTTIENRLKSDKI